MRIVVQAGPLRLLLLPFFPAVLPLPEEQGAWEHGERNADGQRSSQNSPPAGDLLGRAIDHASPFRPAAI